jgi:hypothetical protein
VDPEGVVAVFPLQHLDGTQHVPARDEAYVKVRLTEPTVPPTAPVTVYLADGTGLVVCARDLLRLAPADDAEE